MLAKNVGVGAPLCVKLRRVLERRASERGVVGGAPCEYTEFRVFGVLGREEEVMLASPP